MLIPSKYLIAAVIIHGCLGCFEDLIAILFIKAPVPLSHFYNDSLNLHYGILLNENGVSQVFSIFSNLHLLGSLLSLIFILPKIDSFGRKAVAIYFRTSIAFLAVLFMLLGRLFASIELFAGGNILLGAATPLKMGATRIYISECSPDNIRGFITQSLSAVVGYISISFTILLLPQFLGNDANWHYVFNIAIGIIIVFFVAALFIPESPKFLWFTNRKTKAEEAIRAFHGASADVEEITYNYDIERSMVHSKSLHTSFSEIWSNIGLRNSLILVFATTLITTLGPIQIYSLYSITLKIKYGFSNSQALTFELICNLVSEPLYYVIPFLYEKIGRRPIFLFSICLSFLGCIFMASAEYVFELNNSTSNSITFVLSILFTICIDLSMAFGILTFSILLIADLLPSSAKASTVQAMMLTNSILAICFNFVYSFFQPILGFSIFIPIILIQIFLFVYLYFNLPETKQKAVYQNFESVRSRAESRRGSFRSRISTYNNYGTV